MIKRNSLGQFLKGRWVLDNCICETCRTSFRTKPSRVKIGKGKFCSKRCKYTAQNNWWKGRLNPRWNGGLRINQLGYRSVKMISRPSCNKDGYIKEHRLVMERYLGRSLTSKEIVHHIDGNKSHNYISNLLVLKNQSEHVKLHGWGNRL